MKVVVTGASGLLGRAVAAQFNASGHKVIGTALSRAKGDLVKLDLTDEKAVQAFITEHNPDVLVHCAAERRPDVAEKDHSGTVKLNVTVPGLLGSTCKANGISLLYISTDYVFDGTAPPYEVDAIPNPLNFYGETKLNGEKAIQEVYPGAMILRVPILYGETEYNGESAINTLVDAVTNQGKSVDMDNFAARYPTNVKDVARVIKDLAVEKIEKKQDIGGVFHFSNEERFTKYTICQIFGEILKLPIDHLKPQNDIPVAAAASRPKDAQLSIKRLKDLGIDTTSTPFAQWSEEWLSPIMVRVYDKPEDKQPLLSNTIDDDQPEPAAAERGSLQSVAYILENHHATPNDVNADGYTALHYAAAGNHVDCVSYLLDSGADIDSVRGELQATPLHWAARAGSTAAIHRLLQAGADPTLKDGHGSNVLHLAVQSSQALVILYLAMYGLDLNTPDGVGGYTALMWAANQGNALMVDLLLRFGADVHCQDNQLITALHWAIVKSNRLCIQHLVKHGADANVRDRAGKSPMDLVHEMRLDHIWRRATKSKQGTSENNKSWIISISVQPAWYESPPAFREPGKLKPDLD
ncbi:Methionine adenosyltransferase 2 subunit beta [Apophysomyces sp. BC1034]|nr:Methionine adenosyltransferase 2 subunit beta [Apophysomyces sp. BC1034]